VSARLAIDSCNRPSLSDVEYDVARTVNQSNGANSAAAGSNPDSIGGRLRAFWDFLVLFSGISTASNLTRTRRQRVFRRGLFLFRGGRAR